MDWPDHAAAVFQALAEAASGQQVRHRRKFPDRTAGCGMNGELSGTDHGARTAHAATAHWSRSSATCQVKQLASRAGRRGTLPLSHDRTSCSASGHWFWKRPGWRPGRHLRDRRTIGGPGETHRLDIRVNNSVPAGPIRSDTLKSVNISAIHAVCQPPDRGIRANVKPHPRFHGPSR